MPRECSACGFTGPEDLHFCGRCGAELEKLCPTCGFANGPDFNFCGRCGAALAEPAARSPTAAGPGAEAERRQLTVMFCDLAGSTVLSERYDPEDLRDLVREYQAVCFGVCHRFGGHVAQYLGDGLLVYFGYPRAHEDDARRAVSAGLGIVEALEELNRRLESEHGVRLSVRVGVHTGLVVLGEVGAGERREHLALGETPNLAARIQGLAEPGSVAVSEVTWRLVQGLFSFEDLGPHILKGISRPVEVYRALGESGIETRFELAAIRGLPPLIGRQRELDRLLELLDRAREGRGQVALVTGEAGIGKSRLVQALEEHLLDGGATTTLTCRCSAFHQGSAFYPIVALLTRTFRLDTVDSPGEKLALLEGAVEGLGLAAVEAVPLLAAFLAIPPGERHPPPALSPQRHKEKTLDLLATLVAKMAERRPVVFLAEDLHWADPSTLELLELLVERVAAAPVLLLLVARPSFEPTWAAPAHQCGIRLEQLGEEGVAALARHFTGGRDLPPELLREMVKKTGGVPLFVEELTKMVLETEVVREADGAYELAAPLGSLAIPATLQDSLMARLDRLAEAKAVAQLGAVCGREFTFELLAAVSRLDGPSLRRSLDRLMEADLVHLKGASAAGERYLFKHALIQETAYGSLLRKTRRHYHRRIAEVLTERFGEVGERHPEILAWHHTQGGQPDEAVTWRHRAGQKALERFANREAVEHLEEALRLLARLEPSEAPDRRELLVLATLAPALSAIEGFAAAEVERTYSRAFDLCRNLEDAPELFWVTWGLWAFYIMRAQLATALDLARQLGRIAGAREDSALLLEARFAEGSTRFFLGELEAAHRALEEALALDSPERDRSAAFATGQEVGVILRSYLALTLWHLGHPDRAVETAEAAVEAARRISHPFTLTNALLSAACLCQFRREGRAVEVRAREAMRLSEELGFFMVAQAQVYTGWAQAEQTAVAEGDGALEEAGRGMIRALDQIRGSGARIAQTHVLSLVVETCLRRGSLEEAREVLEEALAAVGETGERFWEAELYRLEGELLLAGSDARAPAAAEASFRRALEIARGQGSKALALRAAGSLGRLWAAGGETGRARALLEEVCSGFTEGFETADLRQTRELLEAWS